MYLLYPLQVQININLNFFFSPQFGGLCPCLLWLYCPTAIINTEGREFYLWFYSHILVWCITHETQKENLCRWLLVLETKQIFWLVFLIFLLCPNLYFFSLFSPIYFLSNCNRLTTNEGLEKVDYKWRTGECPKIIVWCLGKNHRIIKVVEDLQDHQIHLVHLVQHYRNNP